MTFTSVTKLDHTLRNARRFREILGVLIKHGFAEILIHSGVGNWSKEFLDLEISSQTAETKMKLSGEERLRMVIEDLGPTFIKMGQIMSTRPDLIPAPMIQELTQLQTDVPPVDFSEIDKILKFEFGSRLEKLFTSIDTVPIGSASLAQAHKAIMHDGTEVVIKVLKPGIRQQLKADIGILTKLADFTEKQFNNLGFSPVDVVKEFGQQLLLESDYITEANSTERLSSFFADDSQIFFPAVYREASTKNVLTLELIKGTLASRVEEINLSEEIMQTVVKNISRAVLKQCLEFGFFHADPHPGNIFVYPDGRICMIDCGMVGHIENKTAEELADLCSAIVASDVDKVLNVSLSLTDADPTVVRSRRFRNDIWELVSRFQNSTLESINIGRLLSDFFDVLQKYKIRCPGDLVFLIKALTTVEGVVQILSPQFDLISYAKPYIEKLVMRRYGPKAIAKRLRSALLNYGELFEDLPDDLRDFMNRILADKLQIKLKHQGLGTLSDTIRSVTIDLSLALTAAALLVGSSILILADRISGKSDILSKIGVIGYVGGLFLILWIVITNYRQKRH